ncbi:MAG: anti-sigma factor [Devosia sp.]
MSDESNISGPDEDSLLIAEYVLGLLPEGERAGLRTRLKAEPALRSDLNFWRSRLASLDVEFAESTAPAGVWPRIEQRLFIEQARAGFWNSLALWRSVAAGALAVAAIAVALNVTTPKVDPKAFAAELVAALTAEGSNVSFVALYNSSSGKLRLTPLSGEQPTDKDYELWAIQDGSAPKSMGVIAANARNDVKISQDILIEFGEGTTLAVTLETKGGSPTGVAQGPIVALGKATQI